MENLERILGTLFLVFPQLFPYQKEFCYSALRNLFLALYGKGTALRDLISRIGSSPVFSSPSCVRNFSVLALQGLTLTCSVGQKNGQTQEKNYLEYIDLWRNILNPFKYNKKKVTFPKVDQIEMRSQIYNEFMSAIILMLQKLTLNYTAVANPPPTNTSSNPDDNKNTALTSPTKTGGPSPPEIKEKDSKTTNTTDEKTDGPPSADILGELEKTLVPEVPKDFELFLNLVEFCKSILSPPPSSSLKRRTFLVVFSFR